MPPKPKFTREEIIAVALEIVSQQGVEALTARELGKRLDSSARPIFTLFSSMEEVQAEVRAAAMRRFEQYAHVSMAGMPLFKQVGMRMVLFGMREPKLYQLLFMQEHGEAASFEDMYGQLGETAKLCMEAIRHDYALSEAQARELFENVWIYTFGVGALCATGACHFSEKELGRLLSTQFQAMMLLLKSTRAQEGEQ